ncbi:TatD family hydrolase [Thermodesulfobacteriota bacterium]
MTNIPDLNASTNVLIDSHAHLELEPLLSQVEAVVARALKAGVKAIVTVGIDLADAKKALEIAGSFENVFCAVGFHPHNAEGVGENELSMMTQLAGHPKVVAYGEIGLDFFRNYSPRDDQERVFGDQLTLAKKLGKPVIIHLRNAYEEGLRMLEGAAPFPAGGVIHCFSGNEQDAKRAMGLGFYISIPGTITYNKNNELRSIAGGLPEDRILIETDCPFLSPEPKRGKDNEPANIVYTAKTLAKVRNASLEQIARSTTLNAVKLFDLPGDYAINA